MVKGCEGFRYIVKQWEREWRESQDGSLLPKPGDYQAMNTAEKAGAGPATSWPPSPYPRAARGGGRGGGEGGEVFTVLSSFKIRLVRRKPFRTSPVL